MPHLIPRNQEVSSAAAAAPRQAVTAGDDVWMPSVCKMCGNGCGILVHRVNGVVVKIEGDPDNPHNFGRLCAKGHSAIMALYDPRRLRSCLRRTNPHKGPGQDPGWKEISREEAVEEVATRLRKIVADDPRKLMFVNGIGENEMSRLVGSAFAEAFRTPNFTTGVFFGTHTRVSYLNTGSMHTEPDLDYCRLLILFGSQKGSVSGHDTMKSAMGMANARARGMKVVVFDPVCSPTASKANEWIPLIPGTDGAVALALLHVLLNQLGIMDKGFLAWQTNGPYLVGPSGRYLRHSESGKPLAWDSGDRSAKAYDDPGLVEPALAGEFEVEGQICRPALELLRSHVAQYSPERVEAITTVPAVTLRRLAREFGETAQIGSTIAINGVRMPLRPVCSFADSRGSTCHTQGLWTGTAIQLLNVVVGAVDVPGGSISTSIVGPEERLRVSEGLDGMIVYGSGSAATEEHYPGRRPRTPESVQLHELFPVGRPPRPMLGLALLDFPELIPYQVEMLILMGSNVVMSGADPGRMAQAFEKIPFVVGLGDRLNETLECADLVFPITQGLERLDFPVNRLEGWVTGRHWYFAARQPAVEPPEDVHHPVDIFIEWADRSGLLPELNERLNAKLGLAVSQKLQADRKYRNAEIVERRMRSMFGEDHDLRWFREHGLVTWERTPAERYPRGVLKMPRVPVYFPYLLDRAQELKEVLDQLGLNWDLSTYRPVPVWYGCWSHQSRQSDQLFVVNYKLPFQTSTTTQYNTWLAELSKRHRLALYVMLNRKTASDRDIADGDVIELLGTNGYKACGVARLSECVHPDVVAIASCFGHWSRGRQTDSDRGVNFNSFIPLDIRGMEMLSGDYDQCALVTVRKLRKGPREALRRQVFAELILT
ncbi:MAG: molybdopterin-dependent oxidoreductase [Deltaproteobacteria bacterium]|nr:molybdopterin-dependent oxidoreductase [Deltaproteobacteria bacterium]